jgi:hypothetical protein
MNKKPLLAVILVLAAALLLATTAFAQEADEEPDLIRVEIRNNSDGPVFIVLTTGDLSQAQQDGTTGADMTQEEFLAQSLGLEVGLDADPDRLIAFGLSAGANQTSTFTVPRGVYIHRTTACGQTVDGVVDLTRQLRLMIAPCGVSVANNGEPSMEKISFQEDFEAPNSYWQYQQVAQ